MRESIPDRDVTSDWTPVFAVLFADGSRFTVAARVGRCLRRRVWIQS